jgi:uncharacterized membrane-anchored protein
MDKKYIPLLAGIVPILVIVLFLGAKLYTTTTGTEILLKTAPVDPRDLFRGDYVILSYDIATTAHPGLEFERDENIYAALSKKEKYWTIDKISKTKPALAETQVCLKGKVRWSTSSSTRVTWGIESYFVPEGAGRDIERQRRNLSVIVSVDGNCRSVVKELLMNDEVVKFN